MSKEYRDECVGCPPEMSCVGDACPNRNVEYTICDECNNESDIMYNADRTDLCTTCFNDWLNHLWSEMSVEEKANALGIDYSVNE